VTCDTLNIHADPVMSFDAVLQNSACGFAHAWVNCDSAMVKYRDLRIVFFPFESNLESNRPYIYHASRNTA